MTKQDKKKQYADFSNVRRKKNYLIPEEFPEGAFGSSIKQDEPVQSKSTPWQEGQQRDSAFVYPDREQHEDVPRQADGAHPLHDYDDEI
ncbi:hypothetical protein [Ornithinibacillus contaminans]|uniref:hypothetical protein n=1 Tax=Ornithinibacillus contaminans TaxID=694055 RepID=UPI00064DE2E2|nr:hypothetical protein [Ornithinibacillus contaminans]